MLIGSGRGIGGTATRPAPSRPRLDWLVLLLVLRTDTEVRCEELREARERPDSEREEREEREPLSPLPVLAVGTAGAARTGSGARPHSVQ